MSSNSSSSLSNRPSASSRRRVSMPEHITSEAGRHQLQPVITVRRVSSTASGGGGGGGGGGGSGTSTSTSRTDSRDSSCSQVSSHVSGSGSGLSTEWYHSSSSNNYNNYNSNNNNNNNNRSNQALNTTLLFPDYIQSATSHRRYSDEVLISRTSRKQQQQAVVHFNAAEADQRSGTSGHVQRKRGASTQASMRTSGGHGVDDRRTSIKSDSGHWLLSTASKPPVAPATGSPRRRASRTGATEQQPPLMLSAAQLRALSVSDKFIDDAKKMVFVPSSQSFCPRTTASRVFSSR